MQQTVVENTYKYLFRLPSKVNGLTVKNTFLASNQESVLFTQIIWVAGMKMLPARVKPFRITAVSIPSYI